MHTVILILVIEQEDEVYNCLRPPPPYPGGGEEDSPTQRRRIPSDSKSALSALGPILAAHGLSESTLASVVSSVGTSNGTTTTSVSPANSKVKKMKVEKEKDPNAPRKPANAFLMFCQQRRSVIQEEFFKVNCVGFFCCL